MSAPETNSQNILQPPYPGMHTDISTHYKFLDEIWKRSGGYTPATTNLNGLTASVKEINTLVGINTDDTVQEQLDLKSDSADLGTIASQDSNSVAITGGTISAVTISNSNITVPVGLSGLDAEIGGTLIVDTTSVGNVGAGEDTLIDYPMTANALNLDGNYLEVSAWGVVAANANNKTIKLKFGTTTIYNSTAVAANSGSWFINAKIIRTGTSAQQIIVSMVSDNTLIIDSATFTSGAEDLTAAKNIFCTGEATANDDIVQQGLLIKWYK